MDVRFCFKPTFMTFVTEWKMGLVVELACHWRPNGA